MNFKKTALLSAILLALTTQSAQAVDTEIIYNKKGEAVFELRIFNPGDGNYGLSDPDDPNPNPDPDTEDSTFVFDDKSRQKIRTGLERWAEILTLRPGHIPSIINLGSFDDENAYASSITMYNNFSLDQPGITYLQGSLLYGLTNDHQKLPHALIRIGRLPFDEDAATPSQLPLTGQADYIAVVFHEMAHALGIANSVSDKAGPTTPYYASRLNRWTVGLRDDNGNPARPNQAVLCVPCNNAYDPDAFDLRKDQGYFTGVHVQEVLNGAMPGIPVSILLSHDNPQYGVDNNYMSHIELRNSLMSHQSYRNYTNLMEAEIAALQDMGLQIDRRNFFGYSVYGDDVTLVNINGFFARNEEGTAYLPGQYNSATQGLGLHVYGERNTITQAADLLTTGPGGIGVRVDGSENTVIVPTATRIHAQGWYGRGLQFSYGRHHNLVQQGEVRADGEEGIGVLFDFGSNAMGDEDEYRGSWLLKKNGKVAPEHAIPDILRGALISNYDLSGILSGNKAAIKISKNAWVENINVMQGAQIQGDILSDYSSRDPDGELRLTRLSFGPKADAQGHATSQADPNFRLRHDGNIQGIDNLAVVIAGGLTSLNGDHELYGMRVDAGATLAGNSTYTLNPENGFLNNGTLSPGNSFGTMEITGNFTQGPEGRMLIEANTRQHDLIVVNGIAELAGELSVQLQPDWYENNWSLNKDTVFHATQTLGSFDHYSATLVSPTLSVQADNGLWTVQRNTAAYSQYATNPNARAVGRSLEQASSNGQRPLADIYQALDFSNPDGSQISGALDQLSAGAYGAQLAASLRREQLVSDQLRLRPGVDKAGWQAFIQPFGGSYRWQFSGNSVDHRSHTYGVLFGAEHRATDSDWTLGVHATANEQRVNIDAPYNGKSTLTGLGIGVHALYRPEAREGWSGVAQLRAGVEEGKMHRKIAFAEYEAKPSSDWTGHTLAAGVQTAYNIPLGEMGSIGPVVALDYVRYSRPSISESSNSTANLKVDSTRADALQASLGVAVRQGWDLNDGARLQAKVAATWEQQLLGRNKTQHASFEASPQVSFDGRYARIDRSALALQAGVTLNASEHMSFTASMGTRVLGDSRAEVNGQLSINWKF